MEEMAYSKSDRIFCGTIICWEIWGINRSWIWIPAKNWYLNLHLHFNFLLLFYLFYDITYMVSLTVALFSTRCLTFFCLVLQRFQLPKIGCPREPFWHKFRERAGTRLIFCRLIIMFITQHIKNLGFIGDHSAIKFLHGRVLWNFLIAISKILDFLTGLKIRSKAPARYKLYRITNDWKSQNCDWVLFSVTRFKISRTP